MSSEGGTLDTPARGGLDRPAPAAPAPGPGPDPGGRRAGDPALSALHGLGVLRTKHPAVVFVLSLFSGLVVSSLVLVLSVPQLRDAWGSVFTDPGGAFSQTFRFLGSAYGALLRGAVGDPAVFQQA